MWQCSNCGTTNTGNLCQRCKLPAYRADAAFRDNFSAGEYDALMQEQPLPEQPQAYRRPRRKKGKAAWLFCLLALILSAVSLWQSLRPIYRFSLTVDTENISQTLESVLDYVDFDLVQGLDKLSFDGTYSIRELYAPDGKVRHLTDNLRSLTQQAEEALRYLQYYGYVDAGESIGTAGINRLLDRVTQAQQVVKAFIIGLAVLLVLGLVFLLFKKSNTAAGFITLSAILTAALPILACTALSKAFDQVGRGLSVVIAYGIGFRASFALNGSGMAVILLSAAALVFVIFSRIAKAFAR